MKKSLLTLAAILSFWGAKSQVGMNCQYVPGIQLGVVSVKTNNDKLGNYRYSAGLPLMMIDRITNHWYVNMDMNGTYYAVTQTNKANSDAIKIAKTEGGWFSMRLGYAWGKGDQMRIGGFGSLGSSTSNLDSTRRALETHGYTNLGGGLLIYKKFGKIRVMAKLGYEKLASKSYITKASHFYFEGTIGYSIFQKYGVSIMPVWSSKRFDYMPHRDDAKTQTEAKVKYFGIRLGLTKFF